ncbi:hypothetical protein FQR65_LT03951 [Abscondita terminalis]|nr:hypothetical protein FQR65_LT03951 [Abscondita terminalis]
MFAPSTIDEHKFEIPIVDLTPTEVWDDEERESYNPEEHCLNNPILRKKDTLSKAQRKNFRWEERQRMQQFYTNNDNKGTVAEASSTSAVAGGGQPRRPKTFSKGLDSKTDLVEDDVSDLMKKIHLGPILPLFLLERNLLKMLPHTNLKILLIIL